jgi:hypothetical protein
MMNEQRLWILVIVSSGRMSTYCVEQLLTLNVTRVVGHLLPFCYHLETATSISNQCRGTIHLAYVRFYIALDPFL